MKTKVARWGNSLGLRLPKAAVDATGLKAGDEVDVSIDHGDLRVKRSHPIPYYRLEDLLAEMDRLGPGSEPETLDWGPDRGSEIIDDAYSRGEITLEDILTGKAKAKAEAAEAKEKKKDKDAP